MLLKIILTNERSSIAKIGALAPLFLEMHTCMHACMHEIFSKVFYDTSHMWYITLEKELELYLLWFWLDAMEYKRSYTTSTYY